MKYKITQEMLRLHAAYLRGESEGVRIANLSRASLSRANLSRASLSRASLSGANLSWADLSWADLSKADLSGADLSGANLSWANLSGANLSRADLSGANLSGANLSWANLSGADLKDARLPPPTMLLLASWGDVSPKLCRDLMRFDAANCPGGLEAFDKWKDTGVCPYKDAKFERAARFYEKQEYWDGEYARKYKTPSALSLAIRCIQEKCKDSDYHKKDTRKKEE